MKKIELKQGVSLTLLNTSQFKDVLIAVRFLTSIDRKKNIIRLLLSQMLYDRCHAYPTKQAVSDHMDELYGASAYTRSSNYGEANTFEFRFKCINEQYTNENTFERLFKTAHEFIFNPLMSDNLLDKGLFEEAKREVCMANMRKMDNPQSRGIALASNLFGEGYALSKTQVVTNEEIMDITLEEVTKARESMLQNDEVMIFIVGKLDEEKTIQYTQRFFEFEARKTELSSAYLIKKDKLVDQEEVMKIDQTILTMIYQSSINVVHPDYWKSRVANALFGQLPTSLLFQEVREKRSLCYSISSRTLGYEGGILVTTGIQKSALEEVKECVNHQVTRICEGDFSDEDLNTAIIMLKNAILGTFDDSNSLINFEFQNALLSQNETRDDSIKIIESTTKEDVMRIFKDLKHVVTFSLVQEEENEDTY